MTTTKPATIVVFCLFLWVLSVLFMGLLLLWNRCLLFVYKPMLWRLTIYLFICLFIYFRNNHNNTGPAFKWWWQSSDGQGLECEVALPHCIFTGSLHRAWGHLCVRHTQMLGTKCFPVPDAFYFLMASTNQDSGKARLCCSQPVGWWGFTIVLTMQDLSSVDQSSAMEKLDWDIPGGPIWCDRDDQTRQAQIPYLSLFVYGEGWETPVLSWFIAFCFSRERIFPARWLLSESSWHIVEEDSWSWDWALESVFNAQLDLTIKTLRVVSQNRYKLL